MTTQSTRDRKSDWWYEKKNFDSENKKTQSRKKVLNKQRFCVVISISNTSRLHSHGKHAAKCTLQARQPHYGCEYYVIGASPIYPWNHTLRFHLRNHHHGDQLTQWTSSITSSVASRMFVWFWCVRDRTWTSVTGGCLLNTHTKQEETARFRHTAVICWQSVFGGVCALCKLTFVSYQIFIKNIFSTSKMWTIFRMEISAMFSTTVRCATDKNRIKVPRRSNCLVPEWSCCGCVVVVRRRRPQASDISVRSEILWRSRGIRRSENHLEPIRKIRAAVTQHIAGVHPANQENKDKLKIGWHLE